MENNEIHENIITIKAVNTVGRRMKTLIEIPFLEKGDMLALLKSLKTKLGTGGSLEKNTLTLMGNKSFDLIDFLKKHENIKNKEVKYFVDGKLRN